MWQVLKTLKSFCVTYAWKVMFLVISLKREIVSSIAWKTSSSSRSQFFSYNWIVFCICDTLSIWGTCSIKCINILCVDEIVFIAKKPTMTWNETSSSFSTPIPRVHFFFSWYLSFEQYFQYKLVPWLIQIHFALIIALGEISLGYIVEHTNYHHLCEIFHL